MPSSSWLDVSAGDLVDAARKVYEAWDQGDDGLDEALGAGGICQDVASAMAEVMTEAGIDALSVHASVGENHVFVVARFDDGVYAVDIPPSVYEIGSGYVWKKRPDACFGPESLTVDRIADRMEPEEFEEAYAW